MCVSSGAARKFATALSPQGSRELSSTRWMNVDVFYGTVMLRGVLWGPWGVLWSVRNIVLLHESGKVNISEDIVQQMRCLLKNDDFERWKS